MEFSMVHVVVGRNSLAQVAPGLLGQPLSQNGGRNMTARDDCERECREIEAQIRAQLAQPRTKEWADGIIDNFLSVNGDDGDPLRAAIRVVRDEWTGAQGGRRMTREEEEAWINAELEYQRQRATKNVAEFLKKNGDFCAKSRSDQTTELCSVLNDIDHLRHIERMNMSDIADVAIGELNAPAPAG
jgi:hypothetical protein